MIQKPKLQKPNDKYYWTQHSLFKLKQHGLSQSRVKRVIRHPDRVEEGIVENTIAVMQKAGNSKNKTEIWSMYQLKKIKQGERSASEENVEDTLLTEEQKKYMSPAKRFRMERRQEYAQRASKSDKQIKIISAWRYPGETSENDPIPQEIIQEVEALLGI